MASDRHAQKTTLHLVEGLDLKVATRCASGVLVAGRSAGKFPETGRLVDRQVLPMPVAAADEEVVELVLQSPIAEVAPLESKRPFEWLSFLPLRRSGPTIGVGLINTRKLASLARIVRFNHSICLVPQIVFDGPSGIELADRYNRPSTNQICRSRPQRIVRYVSRPIGTCSR